MQSRLFEVIEDMPGGKASSLLDSYKGRIENIQAKSASGCVCP
jgi:hypothetical protein